MKIAVAVAVLLAGTLACSSDEIDPAARAQERVAEAIAKYGNDGLQATVDFYNSRDSIRDESYVFIIAVPSGKLLANANLYPDLPEDARSFTDITGDNFGPELLTATPQGIWIDYWFLNPDTGEQALKHTWLVREEDLIFASGWYE